MPTQRSRWFDPAVSDPRLDIVDLEAHMPADLEERDAMFVHQSPDEPLAHTQPLGKARNVDQLIFRRAHTHVRDAPSEFRGIRTLQRAGRA